MLTFTEENHQYKNDGIVVPSVTQILKGAGLVSFDFVKKEVLEAKATLGSSIHLTTEYFDKGTLDLEALHPTLKAYLDGWIKFKKDFGFEPIEIEALHYHKLYKFAGTLDRTGMIDKKLHLVDIKSGAHHKSHAIQTAAYKMLHDQGKPKKEQIKKRIVVHLKEDGTYKVIPNESITDEQVFKAALTIFNYHNK